MLSRLLLFASVLTFLACSSNPEKKTETKEAKKEEVAVKEKFATGVVIDKVACLSDTSQSYAMYLPKVYDTQKKFPIIYAFDPHATGKLPISNYKDLAEKYGYIIVGSNNSQNGTAWEQTQKFINAFIADTKQRLSIDDNRMYAIGFSGGARIANALTITNGGFAGVICCGAANPAINVPNPRNNYSFFGMVGDADFNFTEMNKYTMIELSSHRIKHAMITFEGKHEWPKAEIMDEAFLWLQLNDMRKNTLAKNESLISTNIGEAKVQLEKFLKNNKEFEAYELCQKTINYYENLGDLQPFFEAYKKLQTNVAVDQQLKKNEAEWTAEQKLQQEYVQNLQTKDLNWWKSDIASINKKTKSGKGSDVVVLKRLLSYLSLVCYMQTTGAMKQNNMKAAEYFGNLYRLVDPTNTEAHYLMANIYMSFAETENALKCLDEAIKNGFTDKKRLENDPMFQGLRDNPTFNEIKGKIK